MMNAEAAVLSVKDLKVVFSGFKALKGVNLDVGSNEIVTIIGPNGAGKSTLLDAIVGKSPVASGHVYYQGRDITNKNSYDIARMGIGRKFQNPNVYNELSVFDNILLALKGTHSVFASIKAKLTAAKKDKILNVLDRVSRSKTVGRDRNGTRSRSSSCITRRTNCGYDSRRNSCNW